MTIVGRFIREPLLHFLLIGSGLFLLFNVLNDGAVENPNRIVISQGQVELLAASFARTWERPATHEEMQNLVDDYLRDEVYYREALALGLDEGDNVIRRRLRQKLGFILEDTAALLDPSDAELTAYMIEHAEQFRFQPQLSFRQVYLSTDTRSDIEADARAVLAALRAGEDPQLLGDQIMLSDEYVLASQEDVERRFGGDFAHQLLALAPGDWVGPLSSGYGAHLVLITELRPGRMPELDEVMADVKGEWLLARTEQLKQDTFRELLKNYEVVMQATLTPSGPVATGLLPGGNAVAAAQPGIEAR